ncbi:MAG TPA: hypothetical protein EYP20_00885 [Aigarchaeota archaeon]|nr:hypothetical protein [Aigarchaeota archaeon]
MLKATLKLELHCPWAEQLAGGCDKISRSTITILQCIPHSDGRGTSAVVKVFTRMFDGKTLARRVKGVKGVKEASFVEVKPYIYLGIVKTLSCPCSKTPLPHLNLLNIRYGEDGKLYWSFLFASKGEFHDFLRELDERKINYTIHEITRVSEAWAISEKQTIVVKKALESGFYDTPRGTTLRGLSQELRISPRAVADILRRVHKKLALQAVEAENLNSLK